MRLSTDQDNLFWSLRVCRPAQFTGDSEVDGFCPDRAKGVTFCEFESFAKAVSAMLVLRTTVPTRTGTL
jgi:hypothetical protein